MKGLPPEVVDAILAQKGSGRSASQVGRELGVSYTTVGKIWKGKYHAKRAEKVGPPLPRPVNPNSEEFIHECKVSYVRCAGCGAMIQAEVPCMACRQKRMLASSNDCYFHELFTPDTTSPFPTI